MDGRVASPLWSAHDGVDPVQGGRFAWQIARELMKRANHEVATSAEDETLTCKDCAAEFVFTGAERDLAVARGHGVMVRCVDCRKAKKARYATSSGTSIPKYDAATESKLDAWVAAKRSRAFDAADKLRSALRADGVDTEEARPVGYSAPAKDARRVKCFNCGALGHRSEDCKRPAGSTTCYHCGRMDHKAKDCPEARASAPFDSHVARCFNCGQTGHISAACTAKRKGNTGCHICGEEGHVSRYCPKAREKPLPPHTTADEVAAKRLAWAAAREKKDYETADKLRAELLAVGVNPSKPPKH